MNKAKIKYLAFQFVGACIEVHKQLGIGLPLSVYRSCLEYELGLRKINFESNVRVPIYYKDFVLESEMTCDMVVDGAIAVTLNLADTITPDHEDQVLNHMRFLQLPKGIVINFKVTSVYQSGNFTFFNELFDALPD